VRETVDRIFDFAIDMELEDGVISVYGLGDDSVIAFTPLGIEILRERIAMDLRNARESRRGRGLRRMLTEMLRERKFLSHRAAEEPAIHADISKD